MDNVTASVARQYTDYAYPEAFADLDARMAGGHVDCADPSFFGPMFWPEGAPQGPLRILIAGCGTVQAAVVAYNNPQSSVVGVDLSEVSLGHERFLQETFGLKNLELFQGDLVDVGKIGREFDLIASTGVLHHLPDPDAGLRALKSVLAPRGALFVMVYGAVARTGVYMLQDVFRKVGLDQSPQDIGIVRSVLAGLHPQHAAQLFKDAGDLRFDAGLVDLYLHRQDRAYTVPQVLEWVERAGLGFQGWFDNCFYYPQAFAPEEILPRIAALPEPEQWAVMEKLLGLVMTHSFVLRHPDGVHRVSFEGEDWLRYRPSRFPDSELKREPDGGYRIHRLGAEFIVNEYEAALYFMGDGTRPIADILTDPMFSGASDDERRDYARLHFTRMWRASLMMFQR